MKTQPITLALILGALPLAAGKPAAKPAVKKVTISVDEIMSMSVIAEYTDLEDMELGKVTDSPLKTRELLVRMHQRRARTLRSRAESLRGANGVVGDIFTYQDMILTANKFDEVATKLKDLKL